jgi:hypothetical protein
MAAGGAKKNCVPDAPAATAVIWLSTSSDSTRVARDLRAAALSGC